MSGKLRDSRWDKNGVIRRLIQDAELPSMVRIRQNFDKTEVADLAAAVRQALRQEKSAKRCCRA